MTTIKLKDPVKKEEVKYKSGQWFKTNFSQYPLVFLGLDTVKNLRIYAVSTSGIIEPWNNNVVPINPTHSAFMACVDGHETGKYNLTPISVTISED